jgi:molecular chaperone DnaK
VNVSAKDNGTGKEQKITITSSSGLNKEDIDKMVKEADSHADDDRRKKDEIEARNKLDSTVYQVEKALNENRSKLADGDVKSAEAALADAKKALEEGGAERMNKAADALNQASHKVFEAMYKGAAQQPGGGPSDGAGSGGGNSKADGEVIDAEYVDADDKKKE